MSRFRFTSRGSYLVMVASSVTLSACTTIAPPLPTPDFQQQLASARTRADHEAIAAIYTQRARDARSAAQEHRWQATTAQLHQLGTADSATGRCAAIVRSLKAKAAEFDELASGHRALAAQSPEHAPAD